MGFTFGWGTERSKKTCEDAKQAWSSKGADFECSGPATAAGVGGPVELGFCGEKLCRIAMQTLPADAGWADAHRDIRAKLEAKYGPATQGGSAGPSECKDELEACLRDGRARMSADWTFDNGAAISLLTGAPKNGGRASLVVVYQVAKGSVVNADDL